MLFVMHCSPFLFLKYDCFDNYWFQLDYKVNVAKLEEVFKIAGNVIEVDLKSDKDGRSRGMATIRFEHPMEAVQAIGILCASVHLLAGY